MNHINVVEYTLDTRSSNLHPYKESDRKPNKGRYPNSRESFKFMLHYKEGCVRRGLQFNTCQTELASAHMVLSYFLHRCRHEAGYLHEFIMNKRNKIYAVFNIVDGNVVQTYRGKIVADRGDLRDDMVAVSVDEPNEVSHMISTRNDIDQPLNDEPYSITRYLHDVLETVYQERLRQCRTVGSKSNYTTIFMRHLIPYFKALNPQPHVYEVTAGMISEFYDTEVFDDNGIGSLLQDKSYKKVSTSTLKQLRTYLLMALKRCADDVFDNSDRTVNFKRQLKKIETLSLPYNENEDAVTPVCLSEVDAQILNGLFLDDLINNGAVENIAAYVSLNLGLRKGEVLGLRWQNIDFERKTLRVSNARETIIQKKPDGRTKKRNQNTRITCADVKSVSTKTRKSVRVITNIPEDIIAGLKLFRETQTLQAQTCPIYQDPDMDYICRYSDGYLLGDTFPIDSYREFLDLHNVIIYDEDGETPLRMRFHDLRHTAISIWMLQGRPLPEVMTWAGHTQITTTQRYTHYISNKMIVGGNK